MSYISSVSNGTDLFFFFFFNSHFLKFIFGCIGSSLLCAGFLQLQRAGATLHCGAWPSHCGGFSCCRARAVGAQASLVAVRGLSSCGAQAVGHTGFSSCSSWALECRLSSCGASA